MLNDITLGQYFPGDTIVHRLDPRTKLIATIIYVVAVLMANAWSAYAFMAVLLVVMVALSRIGLRTIFKGLKPIVIVIVFTAMLNMFFTTGEVIKQFWIFKLTYEGIIAAAKMILRLVLMIVGTFLMTYTTSPIALTDAIEILLGPLKKIRVPVHELAMIMSIALRFVPTLIEETNKIISAQKARGADFDSGSILRRAKALLPVLVPLFISAFRRADELADAMDSRCYNGGDGKTRMKVLVMRAPDFVTFGLSAAVIAGVVFINRLP